MEVTGKVYKIGQVQQVSDKFKKLDLIILVSGTYPQHIAVQFTQDKIDLLNGVKVGDEITVHLNLRGRLWTNKDGIEQAFNSLEGWKVDKLVALPTQGQMEQSGDDLPF